jgi:hypothetical protein
MFLQLQLILVAVIAASTRNFTFLRRHSPRRTNRRWLQQTTENCVATAGLNFTDQVLGKSSGEDSLYKNVAFRPVFIKDDSARSSVDTLPIDDLASLLLDVFLVVDAPDPFLQANQYLGRNGEYTNEILKQHELLIKFWQIPKSEPPILLIGLHGTILAPEGNLERAVAVLAANEGFLPVSTYVAGFVPIVNITDEVIAVAAQARVAIETELPDGYSNFALTEDAYFQDNYGVIGYENSSVIVIGDGAWQFDESLGHGTVGPDILHAHEFSHALQYTMDLEDVGGDYDAYIDMYMATPAIYGELEADAMGAYVLAHYLGRDLPVSLLLEASKSSFSIGDCSVNFTDHHGTPKQRECATKWGADEGLDMGGGPVSPRVFRSLFKEAYESILALDPKACSLTDDYGYNYTNGSSGNNTYGGNIGNFTSQKNNNTNSPPNALNQASGVRRTATIVLAFIMWTTHPILWCFGWWI